MNTDNITNNYEKNTYQRKSVKRIALWLAAFSVAFLLWFYVTSSMTENVEYADKTLDLEIQHIGTETLTELGLGVEQSDFDMITMTVYGEKNVVEKIKNNDIKAYVDIRDQNIENEGEYTFNVKFDTGKLKGITCTYQSVDSVTLKIDKKTSQTFLISSTEISLSGWTLDVGYTISSNKTTNIHEVVIEGMTLDLNNIKTVKIESASVNVISGGGKKETDAKIVLYDSQGKVIDDDDFIIKAYRVKGSERTEVKDILISFEVVKQPS